MCTINNPFKFTTFLKQNRYLSTQKKCLLEKLAKDPASTFIMSYKLNIEVYFPINTIDIAITLIYPKVRLSPKSVPKFDEECKEMKIKIRRLKKIWKKKEIKESWKDFWIA